MTRPLLIALLDTLLPGDDGGPDGVAPLPAFSQAEIDPAPFEVAAQPLIAAIDHAAFMRGTAADRATTLLALEQSAPDRFRAFLGRALAAYYQAPIVQTALGWRHEPPQPAGHRLSGSDEDTWRLLDKVRRRGALWRG